MAEDLFTTWHPLNFSPTHFPENFPKRKRLTEQTDLQKERLEKEISTGRYDHLKYLNEHLEIRAVLREFVQEITKEFPNDTEIPGFCNKLFGQCKVQLQAKILKHVHDLEEQRRKKLFPYKRKPLSSSSTGITSDTSSSGLFATSSGSHDFVCDCPQKTGDSDNKTHSSSSCVCPGNVSLVECCECSLSYHSGDGCKCNMTSSSSCSSNDFKNLATTKSKLEYCRRRRTSADEISSVNEGSSVNERSSIALDIQPKNSTKEVSDIEEV